MQASPLWSRTSAIRWRSDGVVTSPTGGSTVSGSISVTAAASDNVGVVGVQFLLNGTVLGAEDTAAPYSVTWNTTGVANGTHTLTAAPATRRGS